MVEPLCSALILATLDSAFRCTMSLVELKLMHCLPMIYMLFSLKSCHFVTALLSQKIINFLENQFGQDYPNSQK
jgi:hypothetical protein